MGDRDTSETNLDRMCNTSELVGNRQGVRPSNSNTSLAERDPMCTNNMNEPGMNRETPSGTMRQDNRQTSPNTRPIPSPSP